MKEISRHEYFAHFINQIAKHPTGKADRGKSKPTTFACTYFGNHFTLVNNQGYTEAKAKRLVSAFRKLYKQYFDSIDLKIKFAEKNGYIILAQGVRLDTPALGASVSGTKVTPRAVDAEYRSVGNAIGQSWGNINTTAATIFREAIWASKYRYDIHIIALIHDALYIIAPDTPEAIAWVNIELIKAMCEQDHVELRHDVVKLEAELDVHDSWATAVTLPNNLTPAQVKELVQFKETLTNDT